MLFALISALSSRVAVLDACVPASSLGLLMMIPPDLLCAHLHLVTPASPCSQRRPGVQHQRSGLQCHLEGRGDTVHLWTGGHWASLEGCFRGRNVTSSVQPWEAPWEKQSEGGKGKDNEFVPRKGSCSSPILLIQKGS